MPRKSKVTAMTVFSPAKPRHTSAYAPPETKPAKLPKIKPAEKQPKHRTVEERAGAILGMLLIAVLCIVASCSRTAPVSNPGPLHDVLKAIKGR